MRVKLKDVAAAAGVSYGTASNTFNRPQLVTAELQARVREAAQRLGYAGPAPQARALRAGKTGLVALLASEPAEYVIADGFARRLLRGAARACDRHRVGLTIVGGANQGEGWSVETALVDGFILFCFEEEDRFLERVARRGLPCVVIDGGAAADAPSVDIDNRAAAAEAARHLIALGHRRFAVLSLDVTSDGRTRFVDDDRLAMLKHRTTRRRLEGYCDALEAAGLDWGAVPIFETANEGESVREAIRALFAAPEPPTAILAMSDVVGRAAISAITALGLAVPQDVSVIGFDGPAEDEGPATDITTIRQPAERKGEIAVEMLLGAADRRHVDVGYTLLDGGTTARLGGA